LQQSLNRTLPTAKPRNKIVVFRLTQDEYRTLTEACRAKGGRNVSEFTRSELMATLTSESAALSVEARFCGLNEGILRIERALADLLARLALAD
jgi:hypothetical protein